MSVKKFTATIGYFRTELTQTCKWKLHPCTGQMFMLSILHLSCWCSQATSGCITQWQCVICIIKIVDEFDWEPESYASTTSKNPTRPKLSFFVRWFGTEINDEPVGSAFPTTSRWRDSCVWQNETKNTRPFKPLNSRNWIALKTD